MQLTIRTYKQLDANLQAFRDGYIKCMIIYGNAGLSKSYRAKRICKGIKIIKCHVSPLGLYLKLHEHKDDLIIIDDIDEIYNEKGCVKLLKAATESEDTRLVSWMSTIGSLRDVDEADDGRVPREFYMTGPILLVCNDWSLHSANLRALGDRARLIHFCPSPAEIHREVATWFEDQEILDFIAPLIPHLQHLSMRVYLNALASKNAVKSGLDWRQDVLQELNIDPVTTTIVELLQDKSLSQNQRAKKFTEKTGHDRATFFRRLKAMRILGNDATLPLVAKSHDIGNAPVVNAPVQVNALPVAKAAVVGQIQPETVPAPLPNLATDIIYRPDGRAGEYSEWAANFYNGCDHRCRYCFGPLVRCIKREKFYTAGAMPYKDVLKRLEADCQRLQGKILTPILLSFTSDAYQHSEAAHKITRQAICILKKYGFRVCVLTKAGMRAVRDFDLLGSGDVMAASLTLIDEADSLKWEPQAALPSDRIEFLKTAKRHGMETWVSLEPVIDPVQTIELIRATRGIVDLYKIGKINYVKAISNKIDWSAFIKDAVATVIAGGQAYYLKDDLFKYAGPEISQSHNPHHVCIMHTQTNVPPGANLSQQPLAPKLHDDGGDGNTGNTGMAVIPVNIQVTSKTATLVAQPVSADTTANAPAPTNSLPVAQAASHLTSPIPQSYETVASMFDEPQPADAVTDPTPPLSPPTTREEKVLYLDEDVNESSADPVDQPPLSFMNQNVREESVPSPEGPRQSADLELTAEEEEQLRIQGEHDVERVINKEDILSRLQKDRVKIKISLRDPNGCGRDYPNEIRYLRKFPVIWKLFSAKRGSTLDEVADTYGYDSCDKLLADLEAAVERRGGQLA